MFNVIECGSTGHMGNQSNVLFVLGLQRIGPQVKRDYSLLSLSFNNIRKINFTSDNLSLTL
jgi:hypothetical protein